MTEAVQKQKIETERQERENTAGIEIVTDHSGRGYFENLKKNTVYCLAEVRTLEGYIPDSAVYEIEVGADGRIEGEPCLLYTSRCV